VLALRPIGNSPVFVMAHGMGYLDMRTMTASDRTCVGLNNSHIVAAAFDVTVASRLHALTADGDLLTLALVRYMRTLDSLDSNHAPLRSARESRVLYVFGGSMRCLKQIARTGETDSLSGSEA
jgi:hypothetical protein